MPVRRRAAKVRKMEISPAAWSVMTDEPYPADTDGMERYLLDYHREPGSMAVPCLREMWDECREEILADWIEAKPGTRPSCWWEWDAPRSPLGTYAGWYYDGTLPEPRRRLGGIGTPSHEALNNVPAFSYGLAENWISRQWEDAFRQDGEDPPRGFTPDPENPPTFESQAAYLERHGLLQPAERRRLKPEDFEPEALAFHDEDRPEA